MIKPSGGLRGNSSPIIRTVVIDNSDVLRPFDAVQTRNGNLEAAVAGQAIFGIIIEIVDKNDLALSPERASLAQPGGATIGTQVPPAVTVLSTNETVDLVAAKVDMSRDSLFSADANANPGTTSGSDKIGGWVDLSDQRTIGESTFTATITTGRTFCDWGVDLLDATNMIVSIHESEIFSSGLAVS